MAEDTNEKETGTDLEPIYHLKGGMVELEDGTMEKSKMFEIFKIPLDDYPDIQLNTTEMRRFRMQVMKMRTGTQAMVPILCPGPQKCPFRMRCPFVDKTKRLANGQIDFMCQKAKFPIARQCPIERDFIVYKQMDYINEYGVDIESPSELGLVNKLAELDVYDYRLTLVLSHGDTDADGPLLMKEQVTGMTHSGDEITRLEEHPAWSLKEKIHKQRMEILNALVGTRREKYKKEAALKQRDVADPSTKQSTLRQKLDDLNNEVVIEAEFTEHPKE